MMTKYLINNTVDDDFSMLKYINNDQSTNRPEDIFVFDSVLRDTKESKVIANTEFVSGLAELNKLLTKSHKLTSKKYSVWTLIALHLDLPAEEIIKDIDNPIVKMLIGSFKFSKIGKVAPAYNFDNAAWVNEEKDNEDYLAYIRPRANTDIANTSYLQMHKNISEWGQNIRFSIRALDCKLVYSLHIELLDLIRKIIEMLLSAIFKPKFTKHKDYESSGTQKSKKFDLDIRYCELCWRLTKKSVGIQHHPKSSLKVHKKFEPNEDGLINITNTKISLGNLGLTHRFCHIHDPSDPKSKYRADIRYKKSFEIEVQALHFANSKYSNFPATFKYVKGYEEDLRKAAYDLVHSKLLLNLHKLPDMPKKSLAAQVFELKRKGLKQSEISRTLNKSRQEVSRANKKLKTLTLARQNESLIYSDTGEAFTLLGNRSNNDSAQVNHVLELNKNGMSVSKIAKSLDRFPHTVSVMLNEFKKSA